MFQTRSANRPAPFPGCGESRTFSTRSANGPTPPRALLRTGRRSRGGRPLLADGRAAVVGLSPYHPNERPQSRHDHQDLRARARRADRQPLRRLLRQDHLVRLLRLPGGGDALGVARPHDPPHPPRRPALRVDRRARRGREPLRLLRRRPPAQGRDQDLPRLRAAQRHPPRPPQLHHPLRVHDPGPRRHGGLLRHRHGRIPRADDVLRRVDPQARAREHRPRDGGEGARHRRRPPGPRHPDLRRPRLHGLRPQAPRGPRLGRLHPARSGAPAAALHRLPHGPLRGLERLPQQPQGALQRGRQGRRRRDAVLGRHHRGGPRLPRARRPSAPLRAHGRQLRQARRGLARLRGEPAHGPRRPRLRRQREVHRLRRRHRRRLPRRRDLPASSASWAGSR